MIKANTKDRTIFGELSIGLVFNDQVSTLDVHINEARNLTGVDGNPPNWLVFNSILLSLIWIIEGSRTPTSRHFQVY